MKKITKIAQRLLFACIGLHAPKVLSQTLPSEVFDNHSAVMLLIEPSSGKIVRANQAAADFYGYNKAELEALHIQEINQFSPQQVEKERLSALNEGRNYFIFQHRLASGDNRTVSVYSSPFMDEDGSALLFSVIQDVSERRKLEQALWHYQSNLEQQVAQQTQEIKHASTVQVFLLSSVMGIFVGTTLLLGWGFLRLRKTKKRSEFHRARLNAIFDAIGDYLIFTDVNDKVLSANRAAYQDMGELDGKAIAEVLSTCICLEQIQFEPKECQITTNFGTLDVEISKTDVMDHDGGLYGHIYLLQNITQRLADEKEQRLASTVFSTTSEGVLVSDKDNCIQMVNRAFTDITGFTGPEVMGKTPAIFNSGRHDTAYFTQLYDALSSRGHWEGEIWNKRKNGEVYPSWLQVSAVFNQHGDIDMYVALFNDITSRKRNEQLMWQQANFDNLTGLANRHHYHAKFDIALGQAQRKQTRVAVCFIDLDRFKAVNDTLGHHIGDLLLIEAANRIRECTRNSDTVARLGGDEFALLLPDMELISDMEKVAEKVLKALSAPFHLEGHEAYVSGSMGITFYPDDGEDRKVLLRNADSAMYKAKENGRNCFQFFTTAMHEHAKARSQLEGALHRALANQELRVVYQPIVGDNRLGCEALLRWHNDALGEVSPVDFIPISEELGLIMAMGEWVLYQACAQARAWLNKTQQPFFVSVNVSSTQFKRQNVVALVEKVLRDTSLPAECLTLEITETVLADNSDDIERQLEQLRVMGVGLAIDDFGTGYSSLGYLKRFPLSKLKIDRAFIKDLPDDEEDKTLISAIISMASKLNLIVIAEGVETPAQLALLQQLGCDYTQGYLHSKPSSAAEFEAFLLKYQTRTDHSQI
ncbi:MULTISPECIES: EAL domain-containing protein [Pseudoalteromonas]|uniref:EAL domain-containing protein n=1 Tax=Pseudoalteromonas obscura TaxID=3048491 RepID=A0ABT7ERI6_9GAMM|nr:MULTISPECIES: EAL domain-containing protein [Pseudoalteromonas]MDK2597659.1 EAL domain-containing protein [Pseudoalteromonas sp. P94(2023)]